MPDTFDGRSLWLRVRTQLEDRDDGKNLQFPHMEDWKMAGTVQEAYRLNQPAFAVCGGEMGSSYSLASVDQSNVMLETVKRAEDGDGWILRLYETDNALTNAALTWSRPIRSAESCNCLEEPGQSMTHQENRISFTIKPYEIKTIRIRK